jgi:hypothetical protein
MAQFHQGCASVIVVMCARAATQHICFLGQGATITPTCAPKDASPVGMHIGHVATPSDCIAEMLTGQGFIQN